MQSLALRLRWAAALAWAQLIQEGGSLMCRQLVSHPQCGSSCRNVLAAGVTVHGFLHTIPRTSPSADPPANPGTGPLQLQEPPAIAEPRSSGDDDLLKDWAHAVSYVIFPRQYLGLAHSSLCPFLAGGKVPVTVPLGERHGFDVGCVWSGSLTAILVTSHLGRYQAFVLL